MPYLTDALSADQLAASNWHQYVTDDAADGLAGLSLVFSRAAKEARVAGDEPKAVVLDLLGAATSLMLTEGAKPPFQPLIDLVDVGRSAALGDFGSHDVAALALAAGSAPPGRLRAHLADVAATAAHELELEEWKSGVLAARTYLELAESHLLTEERFEVVPTFLRGVQLCWVYCRNDQQMRDRYWDLLIKAIEDCLTHGSAGSAFALCAELVDRRRDLGSQVAPFLEAHAGRVATQGDHDTAARCMGWAKKLWYASKQDKEGKRCHLAEGHHLVARADGPGMAMVRAHWLAEGIEVLRKAKISQSEVSALLVKLGQLQRYSMNDFRTRQREIDVTDVVKLVKDIVVGPSLFDCLMQMCFGVADWPKPEVLRADVIRRSQASFLDSLFSIQHVDRQGKVIGTSGPFDPNNEAMVEQAVVHQLREFDLRFRADTILIRCIGHIFTSYHPSMFQIGGIVEASPMIPPGHKESVARGLLAGFNGDWLEAATYLIPKVEPILRHYFQVRGINTIIARDGAQAEMIISDFLEHAQANDFLGAGLVLELKALLTHQIGYCLRHQWAHGLSDDLTIINSGTVCLWWTLWRLVLMPWAQEHSEGTDHTTDGTEQPD